MRTINEFLARMPVSLKGPISYRLGGKMIALQSRSDNNTEIISNLGINNRYRMMVPGDKTQFLFGTPMTYLGERGVLYLSKYLAPSADAVMDVGANWGYFTYFLWPHLNEEIPIFYFEPNEKLFSTIEKNLRQNNMNNVQGYKKGIAGETGTATFFINLTNDLSSTLDKNFVHQGEDIIAETIDVISFDDFVEENPDFNKWLVKVDIENAEPEFIRGASRHMDKVEFLIIEFLEKARKAKLSEQIYDQHGLIPYYINDFTLEYMPREDGRYTAPEYNFLFCRDNPENLSRRLKNTPFKVKS